MITSSEMSLKSFLHHARLMNKVYEDFPVQPERSDSRPRLKALNMSETCISKIKSTLFDEDGSLREAIKNDIDASRNFYINFHNSFARNDQRWQVPIRHRDQCKSCVLFDVILIHASLYLHAVSVQHTGTRVALQSALEAEKVFFPEYEIVEEITLICGGKENQPLHYDVARSFSMHVSKIMYNAEKEAPVVGWEVGREAYNEAMASPYAPSSVLLGMGEGTTVLLAVQKDQITPVTSNKCMIIGGNGETFDVVRETPNLVVIRAERGLMFTGDFRHAGVRNVLRQSPENGLLELLNDKISTIVGAETLQSQKEQAKRASMVIDMLCNFPGLNKLCRFHCTTRLLDNKLKPPHNTVGFTGCFRNPPRSKGQRGPDKNEKRKRRSCQVCNNEECPGHLCRKRCVSQIST